MIKFRDYITENFSSMDLQRTLQDSCEPETVVVSEGLKDLWKSIKDKFFKVVEYLGGLVARVSKKASLWMGIDDEGNVMAVSTPLTASQAYVDGVINKSTTCVIGDSMAKRLTGNKAGSKDALKLYGSGNSLKWWKELASNLKPANECLEYKFEILDEGLANAHGEVSEDNDELMRRINDALEGRLPKPLMIWGAPGIGKTAIVESVLKSNKWEGMNLIIKTMSNETPDSFSLPQYEGDEGNMRSVDAPKKWLPIYKPTGNKEIDDAADEKCGKGVLFIDEFSRTQQQVLSVLMPLINERRMDGWVLGSGWTIICASNRMEDDPQNTELTPAMFTRFANVYYEPTINSWREWADKQSYISPLVTQWLSTKTENNGSGGGSKYFYYSPAEAGTYGTDELLTTQKVCEPRTWTDAMRYLATYSETGKLEGFDILKIPRKDIIYCLRPFIPEDVLQHLLSFMDLVSKIGTNIDKVAENIWKNGGSSVLKSSETISTISLMFSQMVILSHGNTLPTEKEFSNLVDFLIKLDDDQVASYMIDIFQSVFGEGLQVTSDGDERSYIFQAKNLLEEDQARLNNAPEEFKALTDDKARKKWIDNQLDSIKDKNSQQYINMLDLSTAEASIFVLRNKMAPVLSKWRISSIEGMPNYWKDIQRFGKKYQNAIKIALGDGVLQNGLF